MNRLKLGAKTGLHLSLLVIFLSSIFLVSGCTPPPDEPAIPPEVQDEFLAWARPLYKQIERSDVNWLHLSKAVVFYVDDEEDQETVEKLTRESILLHQELLEEVDTASDNEEELIISELSAVLFEARLKACHEIMDYLDSDEKPDMESSVFIDIRESTKNLATTFQDIMKEYEVVWAHLKHY